jgi:hypothetical protein
MGQANSQLDFFARYPWRPFQAVCKMTPEQLSGYYREVRFMLAWLCIPY